MVRAHLLALALNKVIKNAELGIRRPLDGNDAALDVVDLLIGAADFDKLDIVNYPRLKSKASDPGTPRDEA